MKINEFCLEGEEFPVLFGGEFKYIRKNAGISLEQFAIYAGKRSRTTIYNWECRQRMKPWQTNLLIQMVPASMFMFARKEWRKRNKQYVETMSKYWARM